MSFDWIRQQFFSLSRQEAELTPARAELEKLLSSRHEDGRPIGPSTMRLRLRSYADRMAWAAERRAEAAERARQEAERQRYRIAELDETQLQREFARVRRAAGA